MKTLKEFVENQQSGKNAVVNNIVSNFQRFAQNADSKDNGALLLLVASLGLINTNTPQAISAAKRLSQMAVQRAGRAKK